MNKKQQLQETYSLVPDFVREDIVEACIWARKVLTEFEGSGHEFHLTYQNDSFYCSFAKPEWSGDHCGTGMSSATEAIIMSVCEYLCGF